MNKALIGVVVGVLIVAGLIATLVLRPVNPQQTNSADSAQNKSTSSAPNETAPSDSAANGRYVSYDELLIAEKGYTETILFFHAPWCPECRAFEQALTSSDLPDGVQILKIDYDSNTELRKEYGVTLQTTFVKVNADGEKESLWVGYGKDKSLTAVLENT